MYRMAYKNVFIIYIVCKFIFADILADKMATTADQNSCRSCKSEIKN